MKRTALAVTYVAAAAMFAMGSAYAADDDFENAMNGVQEVLAGVLKDIKDSVVATQRKLEAVYPESTKKPMKLRFSGAESLAGQAGAAASQFELDGDARQLVADVFGAGTPLSRSTWQNLFGAPPTFRNDVAELLDVSAVLGMNVVAARVRESHQQKEFWDDLAHETARGGDDQGAGLAERHMAIGMAGIGRVMIEQSETLSSELALLSLRQQEIQSRRRIAAAAAFAPYAALAGSRR